MLFKPPYMTDKKEKQAKAIESVKKIQDKELLQRIAKDAPLDIVRMEAFKKLFEIDPGLDIKQYDDLIKTCLTSLDSENFRIAVDLTDDICELIKAADKASKVMLTKDKTYLFDRIRTLSEKAVNESTDLQFLHKMQMGNYISTSAQETADRKLRSLIAGIKDPYGINTFVCKKCGKEVIYNEYYEKTSNESINSVRQFECAGGCWKSDDLSCVANYQVGKANRELKEELILLCSSCRKLCGYTTHRMPDLPKCTCGYCKNSVQVRATLAKW